MRNYVLMIVLVAIGILSRFIPHPPNVVPLTAIALAGAVYLNSRYAVFVPLVAMIVSDIFLGFYPIMLFVYLSFLLIAICGLYLKQHKTVGTVLLTSLVSSTVFFVVSNFGVWTLGGYEPTLNGLVECYTMAIPFYRNTIVGDLMYVALTFMVFEYLTSTRLVQSNNLQSI